MKKHVGIKIVLLALLATYLSQNAFAQPGRVEVIDQQEIKNFKWVLGGFNTVMMISGRINNKSSVAVKDLTIECRTFSKSDTLLSRTSKVLYEAIPPGKSVKMREFSMGFVNSQSIKAYCEVADLVIVQSGK